MKPTKTTITIENRTIFRILAIITLFILLLQAFSLIIMPLTWVATAIFLAIGLNPAVHTISKVMPRKSRAAAAAVVLLAFFGFVAVLVINLGPPLVQQTQDLAAKLPGVVTDAQAGKGPLGELINKYHLQKQVSEVAAQLSTWAQTLAGSIFNVANNVFSGVIATITIFTLTIFAMLEGPAWERRFWSVYPRSKHDDHRELVRGMYNAITGYINGNLTTSAIAGVTTAILLSILHVPFAIPLGLIVAVLDLIPLVGATIAAIIVIIASLFVSVEAAIIMAVFFIAYQQLENNVLQPLVYGKSTALSPFVVTVAIIIGATLAGLFGALVAIPVAASIKLLIIYNTRDRVAANAKQA